MGVTAPGELAALAERVGRNVCSTQEAHEAATALRRLCALEAAAGNLIRVAEDMAGTGCCVGRSDLDAAIRALWVLGVTGTGE